MPNDAFTFDASAAAVGWLRDLLLGGIATSVAVLAIAAIGLLMLTGRLPARRGATVVVGCFVLFGAGSIADALVAAAAMSHNDPILPVPPAPAYMAVMPVPAPYDPYAGASVPAQSSDTRSDILQ